MFIIGVCWLYSLIKHTSVDIKKPKIVKTVPRYHYYPSYFLVYTLVFTLTNILCRSVIKVPQCYSIVATCEMLDVVVPVHIAGLLTFLYCIPN
jgi:hypothetical protein